MAQKFGRNYLLTISGSIPTITIGLPFTIEFDITRNTLTSANVCQIRVYNLSPNTRNYLLKNVTSGWGYPFIYVTLAAGYGDNFPVIFSGNVSQGWSVRQGNNMITQLECYDAGYAFVTGQTSLTVPKGTPYRVVIANLISSLPNGALPNIKVGAIGDYPGVAPKQTTYSGNAVEILNQITGNGFFIDKGIGNALGDNEYLNAVPVFTVDSSTGLLGTPVLEQNIVRFEMVFEPSLNVGAGCNLQSVPASQFNSGSDPNFNGFYKITAVKHRGMISSTVCGDAITTGEFFSLQTQTAVANFG